MRSFLFLFSLPARPSVPLHVLPLFFSAIFTEAKPQSAALLPRALLCQEKLPRGIQIGKECIRVKCRLPFGDENPAGIGQQQPVNLPAADDKRILLPIAQQGEQRRNICGNLSPRRTEPAAGKHDVAPPGQRARQGFKRLSPHHNRMTPGGFPEKFHIFADPNQQAAVFSDAPVLICR